MKPQTVDPVVLAARCFHHTPSGRRCRLSVSDAHSSLCRQHRAEQIQEQAADYHFELLRNFEGFQTAQGINHSLKHLYELLAQNRISPRRAAILAYINSLLLRTLPQIDADNAAGIAYRPKPAPIDVPVADEDTHTGEHSDLGSGHNEESAGEPESVIPKPMDVDPVSTNTWDPSIPEPDPKKKPS